MPSSSTPSLPTLSLTYLLRQPVIATEHPPLLLLLHGFGSNEVDLFALADGMPPEFLVISVRAPHVLAEGQYAWFGVDFSSGEAVHDKKEAEEARPILKQFIDEVIAQFHVDPECIVLVGFSQGAIMSYSIALTFPLFVQGIGVLSGRILEEMKPLIVASPELAKLEVFLAHGTLDHVLPIRHAREAKRYLEDFGIPVAYHEYPISHTISCDEAQALMRWLTHT